MGTVAAPRTPEGPHHGLRPRPCPPCCSSCWSCSSAGSARPPRSWPWSWSASKPSKRWPCATRRGGSSGGDV